LPRIAQPERDDPTTHGGALRQLARRADPEAELAEIRTQITELQRKTEQRLGASFGRLLGARHCFNGFTPALIERYVCLGDGVASAIGSGCLADMTTSAEFHVANASAGIPTTLFDMPGVNDPFLVRERATLDMLS